MYSFDPAINYGPNDVGASFLSIVLVVLGIVFVSIFLGTLYGFIANLINRRKDESND